MLTEDALAVLENVEVTKYHDYRDTYDDRATAQPFGLPGAGELRDLLAGIDLGYARGPVSATPAAPGTDPRFYFLGPAGAATGSAPATQKPQAVIDVIPQK